MLTLTNRQARALLLRWQGLIGPQPSGIDGARAVMDRLGTIQFDPLNVAGRNPDLVLQARVRNYRSDMLQKLIYETHELTDGLDKEMCVYAARDFGRFAPVRRMNARDAKAWLSGRGQQEAFDMLEDILAIIRERGPSSLSDIPIGASQGFGWGPRRPSGAAIEYLFRSGRLCIAERKGTLRRFDLAERVLPAGWLTEPDWSDEAFANWYVRRRVGCVGMLWGRRGGAWQGYVVSRDRERRAALERLATSGELMPCAVEGRTETFYAMPEALKLLDSTPSVRRARFIAPLDNLLWDRDMLEALFGFRYRWEVYTPTEKREYGYYVLPVLYGDRFVARFEPEPVSKAGALGIRGWWWERDARMSAALLEEIERALARFAGFLRVPCAPENMDVIRAAHH